MLQRLALLVVPLLLASCDPVSTTPVAPPGGAGGASGPSAVASSVQTLKPPVAGTPARIESLERALAASDEQVNLLRRANEKAAEDLAALRHDTEATLSRLAAEQTALRAALADARRTIDALCDASPLPNPGADLPKIEAHVLNAGPPAPSGAVVLLDAGKKQGVAPKYQFSIVRAGRAIAKVLVESVDAEVSTGRIVYVKDGESVREGDLGTTKP